MGEVIGVLGGGAGEFYYNDYMLDASCVAGAVALRSTATNSAGEVVDATTTAAVNALGIYAEAVTYTATPSLQATSSPFGLLGGNELLGATARIITHPFQLVKFRIAGGATSGSALATTSRANILTNSTADTTKLIVTSTAVGTVTFAGGLMKGRTGANMNQTRRIITHNNSTDERMEVAYLNTIAAGDTFIAIPYSKAGIAVQFTTDLTEANGIIATGTGATMRIWDTDIDVEHDVAFVYTTFADHYFNPGAP